jgi:hypothetical protein
MPAQLSFVDRSVRIALRRLVGQSLLNHLSLWLGVSVGLALVWFVVQPLLLESPPVWLRWTVLAGFTALGAAMGVWQTVRKAPTPQQAALEVDSRFDLRERVTTALALTPDLRETPAGEAVTADAEAKAKKLSVGERFPVKPRWTAAIAPVFAVAIAAVVLWWTPSPINFGGTEEAKKDGKGADAANPNPIPADKKTAAEKEREKAINDLAKRENRGKELEELEKEIDKANKEFAKDPYDDISKERASEKAAELTKLEEKAEKIAKEKEQELKQLGEKLSQLEKLAQNDEFKDEGGAEKLNDALAKGDLDKAEEELEGLKKKAKDKELTPEDAKKLSKQLEKMKDELERLDRDKEEKKKELEKKRDEAKKENRPEDAAELDRELEKLKQEQEAGQEELEELGQQLQRASDALNKDDQEEAAKALEQAQKSVEKMQGEVEDLKEAEMRLQKLKGERKQACAQCEGGDKPGNKESKGKSMNNKGGIGSGERDWDPAADTGFEEVRKRSLMDLKGQTQYGGLTKGQGFTKKTDKELGAQLKKAAQDAPGAADLQRLPRDAKDSVAEYFKKLGGTEGK